MIGAGWKGVAVNEPWLYNAVEGSDGVQRWGTNRVAGYWNIGSISNPNYEELFYFTLDEDTMSECTLMPRDSGGPTMIEVQGQLRTIGIHHSLDHQATHPAGIGASGLDIRLYRYQEWIQDVLINDGVGGDLLNVIRATLSNGSQPVAPQ